MVLLLLVTSAEASEPRFGTPTKAQVRAFSEPLLIRIAAGYEAATRHRRPPKDFGALTGEP